MENPPQWKRFLHPEKTKSSRRDPLNVFRERLEVDNARMPSEVKKSFHSAGKKVTLSDQLDDSRHEVVA